MLSAATSPVTPAKLGNRHGGWAGRAALARASVLAVFSQEFKGSISDDVVAGVQIQEDLGSD
jgi:hypothetical protein